MQAVGIVAEYNPFHKGPEYHIAQTRAEQNPDGVIAVMSGNFTQRGEAAVFDKWTRAQMALSAGADLILELPVAFAVRSAGYFAQGAVQTLAASGICSYLSCGVESENTNELQQLADYLASEPEEFRVTLQDYLQTGLSYPAARQKALEHLQIPGASQLALPNNILAMHYLQTIAQSGSHMQPVMISRKGSYNSEALPSETQSFASATAIRKELHSNSNQWVNHVPAKVAEIIQNRVKQGFAPMHMESFAPAVLSLLRRSTPAQLTDILEISEGLENRMYEAAMQNERLDDLCAAIKSKRYTYTRIQRSICHLLLNMTRDMDWQEPEYIRVLGFNSTGQKLLKEMKRKAHLPIIIRPARQRGLLNAQGQQMLDLDCRAIAMYMLGYPVEIRPKASLDLLQMPIQV